MNITLIKDVLELILVCYQRDGLNVLFTWLFSGEKEIPGLTDSTVPRRLGPKRASKIRKLFNLAKEDDVRQYVVRRPLSKEGKSWVVALFQSKNT